MTRRETGLTSPLERGAASDKDLRGYAKRLGLDLKALDAAPAGGEMATRVRADFTSCTRQVAAL